MFQQHSVENAVAIPMDGVRDRLGTGLRNVAGLVLAGALVTSCSAGGSSSYDQAPQVPEVAQDANPLPPSVDETIDTSTITDQITQEKPKAPYAQVGNGDVLGDLTPSLPILDAFMYKGRLSYSEPNIAVPEAAKADILSTIEANKALIGTDMALGHLSMIHMRIYKPNLFPKDPTLEPTSYMEYASQDATNHGQGDVYYNLPADDQIDTRSMEVMLRHELTHALFGHGRGKWLQPAELTALDQACHTLRSSALAGMSGTAYDAADGLSRLKSRMPRAYARAFRTVISAAENDNYGSLHSTIDSNGSANCFVADPYSMVRSISDRQGLSPKPFVKLWENDTDEVIPDIADTWLQDIESQTVYQGLRESEILPTNKQNERAGHPDQGSDELVASTINLTLSDPEHLGQNLNLETDSNKQAVLQVIDLSIKVLQHNPRVTNAIISQLQANRAKVAAAMGQ